MERSGGTSTNLLNKVINREIHGSFFGRTASNRHASPFNLMVPARLSFKLSSLFPESALEAGIILLGFSRCGRFLITYTQNSELSSLRSAQGLNYVYHMQWWLFKPPEKAKKISEVQLFGEFVIWHQLYISVDEWPGTPDLIVVFGYDKMEEKTVQTSTCYVTVTAVPSPPGCRHCRALQENVGEEFLCCDPGDVLPPAQCLRHGVTIHTSCSVVPPFPKSTPLRLLIPCAQDEDRMTEDNAYRGVKASSTKKLVLSTGNFIHAFKVQILEPLRMPQPRRAEGLLLPLFSPPCPLEQLQLYRDGRCFLSEAASTVSMSDLTSVPESVDSRDELSANGSPYLPPRPGMDNFKPSPRRREAPTSPRGMESATTSPTKRPTKFFARNRAGGVAIRPDDAYAFVDESLPANENLSTYRKKRLAERTYEFSDDLFSDENTEASLSIAPWSRRLRDNTRRAHHCNSQNNLVGNTAAAAGPFQIRSPTYTSFEALTVSITSSPGSHEVCHPMAVLRQLNYCPSSNLLLSPREMRDYRDSTDAIFGFGGRSPASSSDYSGADIPCPKTPPVVREKKRLLKMEGNSKKKLESQVSDNPWVAEFTRFYMDADDELVSVFSTDFDDDDLGTSTGYHNALPLEVHGTAYSQMQQVSRSKVGRVGAPIVVFNQISMDMEEFCHKMAEKICAEAGEKYWSCEDFDVAVLTQNYETGSILCCAEMLVRTKNQQKQLRTTLDSKLYQTGVTFDWHPWTGSWVIVSTKPLIPAPLNRNEPADGSNSWLPAQNLLRAVNCEWHSLPKNADALPRKMDNLPVLQERSLEAIREPNLGVEINLRQKADRSLLDDYESDDSDLRPSSDEEY